jgi:hypothetical protein
VSAEHGTATFAKPVLVAALISLSIISLNFDVFFYMNKLEIAIELKSTSQRIKLLRQYIQFDFPLLS